MADGLAHWVLVVGTHPRVSACLFEDGFMVSDLRVHVRVMVVVQVVHPCFSWVSLVACARVVGGLLCGFPVPGMWA